jgi:hypothetical protein
MRVTLIALVVLVVFDQVWSHGTNTAYVLDLLRTIGRSFGFT